MVNYKSEALEAEAWKSVDKLKTNYVIDLLTAERLHDIFIYIRLSTASKNQRGIDMHRNALQKVLKDLPVIKKPALPPHVFRAKPGMSESPFDD